MIRNSDVFSKLLQPHIAIMCPLVLFSRYLAIFHPVVYQRTRSRRHIVKIIAAIFIAGLVLGSARGFLYSGYVIHCLIWPTSPPFNSYHGIQYYCTSLDETVTVTVNHLLPPIIFTVALLWHAIYYVMIVSKLGSRKMFGPIQHKSCRYEIKSVVW